MYNSFLDLPVDKNKEKILVWPVPYEATASFGKGTLNGPQAIYRASYEIDTWDQELGLDPGDFFYFENLEGFEPSAAGPEQNFCKMLGFLEQRLGKRDFLLTLGGEHSLALGPISFYAKAYPDLVVLQLDAHADLRSEFQGSKYSHACVMRRVMEKGLVIVQLGIRSLCAEESALIRSSPREKLLTEFAWDLKDPLQEAMKIARFVAGRPVYISFDADFLDPGIMPGTGTPEPGGVSYNWLRTFWPELLKHTKLVGLDFCELAPISGSVLSESVAVKCILKVLSSYARSKLV